MIRNYLKIALRSLRRQKGYSMINILGLAMGLASCMIIMLYVFHELSYDTYNTKADRIYRVAESIDFSGNHYRLAASPAPLGPTLEKDYPSVEAATRIREMGSILVRKGDSNIKENRVAFADSTLFQVFTFPMLYGNANTALKDPNTIVITQSIAQKYFGKTDVIGNTLLLNDKNTFKVTGVIKDIPDASHFHFDFLLSMSTHADSRSQNWFSNNYYTYVLLKKGVTSAQFEKNFDTLKKTYIEPELRRVVGVNLKQFKAAGNRYHIYLQSLTSIHLYSHLQDEMEPNGNISTSISSPGSLFSS